MPVPVTRYNVLLSSPGDAIPFCDIAREVIESINRTHSRSTGIELYTVDWRRDSSADSGSEPQQILNGQIVDEADIVLAVFKERFGSPTANYGSGTEEEIRLGLAEGKRVMVYFWEPPAGHTPAASAQPDKISAFRDSLGQSTLYKSFSDEGAFRDEILHDFTSLIFKLENEDSTSGPSLVLSTVGADQALCEQGKAALLPMVAPPLTKTAMDAEILLLYKRLLSSTVRKPRAIHAPSVPAAKGASASKESDNREDQPALDPASIATVAIPTAFSQVASESVPSSLSKVVSQSMAKSTGVTDLQEQCRKLAALSYQDPYSKPVSIPDASTALVAQQLSELGKTLDDGVFYLGNLRRSELQTSPYMPGNGLLGTDAEKDKYRDAMALISKCRQRRDYVGFVTSYEQVRGIAFVLRNTGSRPSAHINVELRFPGDSLVEHGAAPLPGADFIGKAIENESVLDEFVERLFALGETAAYRCYDDACVLSESGARGFVYHEPRYVGVSVARPLNQSDYATSFDYLYSDFTVVEDKDTGEKLVRISFDRAQQHEAYAFPAYVMVRSSLATPLRYRITADELKNPIEGELAIA